MSELQAALDRSIARASPLTRSLFADTGWDAARVLDFVNTVKTITVCSITAGGEPHASFVIAGCIDTGIHFTVSDGSLLQRNLARNQRIAFTVTDGRHAVIGRGDAVSATRSRDDPALVDRLASATAENVFTPADWDGSIFRIEVDRIFAS